MLLRGRLRAASFLFAIATPAQMRASRQLDHQPVADGHAAIHLRGKIEVVRGNDRGKSRGADQLG